VNSITIPTTAPSKARTTIGWLLTALSLIGVAGMVFVWTTDTGFRARPFILLASVAYVTIPFVAGAYRNRYGILTLAGVIFCFLGDVFGPGNFLLGAVMFLIAHLLFIPAFIVAGINRRALLVSIPLWLVISGIVTALVIPSVPPDQYAVIIPYTAIITLMAVAAFATIGSGATRIIPVAAVLFYVSDLFLAQTAFLDGGRIFTVTGYPMYYAAMLLFAWTTYTNGKRRTLTVG